MSNYVIYCVILRRSVLLFLLRFLAVFPSRSPIGGEGNSIASATTSESDCLSVLVGCLVGVSLPPPPPLSSPSTFFPGGKVRKEGEKRFVCRGLCFLFTFPSAALRKRLLWRLRRIRGGVESG